MTMRLWLLVVVLSFAPLYSSEPQQKPDAFAPCEPAVVQALYQTLKDVHDFCTLYDIPYWIDSGTLLGSVRHRGLIPWDDDLDLCIFDTDEQKFLDVFPVLHAAGYEIIGMQFGYKIYVRDGLTVPNYPWKHPGCDIFIMITDGKKASYKWRWGKERDGNLEVSLTDILPLRTYSFGPLIVMGPNNPLPYLKNWYGDDCFTMAYKGYDHATETTYQAVAKKLLTAHDYKTLRPHEPLQHRIKPLLVEQWPVDFMDRYSHLLSSIIKNGLNTPLAF